MGHGEYRPDIDGIRALAVLLVLFFHAGFPPTGGFIGVDVFFVISGYLITDIILREARDDRFSFLGFYARRVRRIVPALLVVIAATLAGGALILLPGAFAVTAESGAFAALGLSNFFFFRNTDYFDGPADLMPLLHTWSLGVEEQFYLVWPLLLVGAVRLSRRFPRALAALFALLVAASLALAIYKVSQGAKSAFYQPFGRAWEFAAGGALVLARDRLVAMPRVLAEALKLAGLAAILIPAFRLTSTSPFPGTNAIAPVVGTALLILPTAAPTLVARVLACQPFPFIGKISYSLYLWHWPVLALLRHYVNGEPLTAAQAGGALAVSVVLAWLSWRFVEQPFRRGRLPAARVVLTGAAATASVAVIGFAIHMSEGMPGRMSRELADLGSLDRTWNVPCTQRIALFPNSTLCVVGADWRSARTRALIWGDSHAEHLMPALDAAGRETGTAIALLRACPAIFSQDGLRRLPLGLPPACQEIYAATLAMLKASPDITLVILASAWNAMPDAIFKEGGWPTGHADGLVLMAEELRRVADTFAAPGRSVVLVADTPYWKTDPIPCFAARDGALVRAPCVRDLGRIGPEERNPRHAEVDAVFRALKGKRDDVVVLVPTDTLCDATSCPARLDGEFLYMDQDHYRKNLGPGARALLAEKLGFTALFRAFDGKTAAVR